MLLLLLTSAVVGLNNLKDGDKIIIEFGEAPNFQDYMEDHCSRMETRAARALCVMTFLDNYSASSQLEARQILKDNPIVQHYAERSVGNLIVLGAAWTTPQAKALLTQLESLDKVQEIRKDQVIGLLA